MPIPYMTIEVINNGTRDIQCFFNSKDPKNTNQITHIEIISIDKN